MSEHCSPTVKKRKRRWARVRKPTSAGGPPRSDEPLIAEKRELEKNL